MVFCRAVSHAYVVLFSVDDNLAGERRKERKKQYSNTKQWAPNTKRERAHESTTRTLKMLLFWASHGRIKSEWRANDAPCSASILVVGGWLAGCKTNIEHNRIEFNSNFVCVCVCLFREWNKLELGPSAHNWNWKGIFWFKHANAIFFWATAHDGVEQRAGVESHWWHC